MSEPPKIHCPYCGYYLDLDDDECWHCHKDVSALVYKAKKHFESESKP